MVNVELKVDGDILTARVNLSEVHGPSKSGKTEVIASTHGNQTVPGHELTKIGLNVYKYRSPSA